MRLCRPGSGRILLGMAFTETHIHPPVAPHGAAGMPPVVVRRGLTAAEVMTAREVAELLHLPVSTVYYLARRGEIPCSRLGRAWRFLRPRIEEMLAQ
jgi:excisionase family DNA binding protein